MVWKKLAPALALLLVLLSLDSCSVMSGRYAYHTAYPEPEITYKPQGILEYVMVPSSEPGMKERRATVYLPSGYYSCDERYPVLYLLHGARGNELTWIERGAVLQSIDSLRAHSAARDFILVLPNMNSYKDAVDYGYSRAKNALSSFYGVDGTVESCFITDVVRTIDTRYRTIDSKDGRAIAGMSIGALQAIYISAGNPDSFDSVGLFSPMAHSFVRAGENSSFYRHLWDKMDRQFADPPKDYCIMIGKTDFFYPHMKSWHRKLDKRAYPHSFHIAEGGHEWYNWEAFAVRFISTAAMLGKR